MFEQHISVSIYASKTISRATVSETSSESPFPKLQSQEKKKKKHHAIPKIC